MATPGAPFPDERVSIVLSWRDWGMMQALLVEELRNIRNRGDLKNEDRMRLLSHYVSIQARLAEQLRSYQEKRS